MTQGIEIQQKERLYFLDWLRVFAVILVLYYHTGMLYVAEWGWHLKDTETSNIMMEWMFFLNRWRMSLLFIISGAGSYFVINSIKGKFFVWERFKRLFIPLVFGMFIIVPPQIYMERLNDGVAFSSYFDFYPTVFQFVPYPKGSFSWHHLWFIFYLFLYSVIAFPVFWFFKSENGKKVIGFIAAIVKKTSIYVFAVPIILILAFLLPSYPGPQNLVNDWAAFWAYFALFVIGFILNANPWFWNSIESNRRLSAKIAFVLMLIIGYFRWNDNMYYEDETFGLYIKLNIHTFYAMTTIFALMGYAKKHLNFNNAFIQYAKKAIYPFYILHQTIIVIIGYYTIRIEEGILFEFLFVSTLTFFITMGLYEFFIRPYRFVRFFFGMK